MKLLQPAIAVRAMLWVVTASLTFGQGPIADRLVVTFPNTTWVGTQSLPAGKYTIRQLPTSSNPRLLEFSSESGTKLEATITTIASIDNNNTRETSVVLEQHGGQYYLKNVWIEGKTYGYEIPVDQRQQVAGKSEKITLTANFAPNQAELAANSAPAKSTVSEGTGVTVPPQPPAPAPVPEPVQEPTQAAQQAPAVDLAPEPTPQVPSPVAEDTGKVQMAAQAPPMPQTASEWRELLLLGVLLCAGGMLLTPWPSRKDQR